MSGRCSHADGVGSLRLQRRSASDGWTKGSMTKRIDLESSMICPRLSTHRPKQRSADDGCRLLPTKKTCCVSNISLKFVQASSSSSASILLSMSLLWYLMIPSSNWAGTTPESIVVSYHYPTLPLALVSSVEVTISTRHVTHVYLIIVRRYHQRWVQVERRAYW
jgi:hypothetical protein